MYVTTFLCEWDIGCNEMIFESEDTARLFVERAFEDCGLEETVEEAEDEGLLTFETTAITTRGDF